MENPAEPQLRLLGRLNAPAFAAPMGLFGAGHVLYGLGQIEGAPFQVAAACLFLLAGAVLLLLTALYGIKCIMAPQAFGDDFRDPVAMNFGSAFAIAVVLGARALAPYAPDLAQILLIFGGLVSFGFGVLVVRQWLTLKIAPEAICPPWFIPVAGNLVAAKAFYDAGFEGIGLLFGGLGTIGWLMVLPLVLYRLVVSPKLPARLRPTLVIFVAPPGLAASAALSLIPGEIGIVFAGLALGAGLFFLTVLLTLYREFEATPFSSAWWSYTFPTAALASGALGFASGTGVPAHMMLAQGLAGLNIALTAGVFVATVRALRGSNRRNSKSEDPTKG